MSDGALVRRDAGLKRVLVTAHDTLSASKTFVKKCIDSRTTVEVGVHIVDSSGHECLNDIIRLIGEVAHGHASHITEHAQVERLNAIADLEHPLRSPRVLPEQSQELIVHDCPVREQTPGQSGVYSGILAKSCFTIGKCVEITSVLALHKSKIRK